MVLRDRWQALELHSRPWLARHPWEAFEPDVKRLADQAAALNHAIAESPLLGADYEIGHTYFFDVVGFVADQPRLRSSATAPGNYLWGVDGQPTAALVDLWSHSLEPLLGDYLSGLDGGARDAHVRELEDGLPRPGRVGCRKRSDSLTARPSRITRRWPALAEALGATPHAAFVAGVSARPRADAAARGRAGRRRLGVRALRRAADARRPLAR